MTRVIKFNIYHKKHKKIYFVKALNWDANGGCHVLINETNELFVPRCDYELMQFTGLLDKNGKEIYEYMEIDNIYEVSFKGGRYILTNISSGDIIALYNYMENKSGQVEITREYTKV